MGFSIQRYAVIPLSTNSGLIGWVPHCDTLHALIRDYREKKKKVPQWELDSYEQMFDAYKKLGGNGYLDDLRKEFVEELSHETH